MKPKKFYALLAAVCAAALLLPPPPAATAQKRRRPPPPRTTTAPAPPAAPRTPAPDAPPQPKEDEHPLEELLSADGYSVVAEVRKLGQLAHLGEVKMAIETLHLFDQPSAEAFGELMDFLTENEEELGDARAVVALMPARANLPEVLIALQLPTAEVARRFEPKYSAFLGRGTELVKGLTGSAAPVVRPARGSRRAKVKRPASAQQFVRRSGNWLLASGKRFTLKQLRGDEGAGTLAESVRFQAARTRFASEALFVYVDVGLAYQGWMLASQREQEERERAALANPPPPEDAQLGVMTAEVGPPPPPRPTPEGLGPGRDAAEATGEGQSAGLQPTATPGAPEEVASPEAALSTTGAPVSMSSSQGRPNDFVIDETAEQEAAGRMRGLLRGIWETVPRIPGAVAAAVNIENESVALRVAVDNPPEGPVNVLPFLSSLISGPPITTESVVYAPDDSDVFVSFSLDWAQIFNAMMGAAASREVLMGLGGGGEAKPEAAPGAEGAEAGKKPERPPTAEETLALVEKFFGFKFKEDLLPALGHEVAISMPLKPLVGGIKINQEKPKEEKDAEPGFVLFVSLNDPDKVRRILPRSLAALGFLSPGAQFQTERREGMDINHGPGLSYAISSRFLVISDEPKAVRHVVDAHAHARVLAPSNTYRAATSWQARQTLVHAYVSEALMESAIRDTKKQAAGSTDPTVLALLAQLDVTPEPASYEATNEGDVLLHEVRLPLSLIRAFSAGIAIGTKEAPVIGNEMMALFALARIREAQNAFISSKERDRYGTLEELIAEDLIEKGFAAERREYAFELNAVGDKYEAKATPKNYGKTGRRSFFLDETGVVRAADHKGKPASASDPPVD